MKAKELMLFDLVRRKRDGRVMTVVEVRYAEMIAAITPDDVYYGDMEDYYDDEIEPIPLTAEILEKNGFIMRDDLVQSIRDATPFIWDEDDITSVVVEWRDSYDNGERDENAQVWDEYWSIYIDGIKVRFEKTAPIIYVHELQGALRLCGINLEIKI